MTGTATLKVPSARGGASMAVRVPNVSVLVPATSISAPGTAVPVTVTGEPLMADSSAGRSR